MKQPMRLKSGGFISSGTDAGDLKILRTAKNIDDGSANGMRRGGKVKKKFGPPSKKKLTDKARNIIRKDKSENKMSSFNKVSALSFFKNKAKSSFE